MNDETKDEEGDGVREQDVRDPLLDLVREPTPDGPAEAAVGGARVAEADDGRADDGHRGDDLPGFARAWALLRVALAEGITLDVDGLTLHTASLLEGARPTPVFVGDLDVADLDHDVADFDAPEAAGQAGG